MASPAEPTLRPTVVLDALSAAGVRTIVVGAYAAQLRAIEGNVTSDLDVTPALDDDNLQHLAETLHALGATRRTCSTSRPTGAGEPDGAI